MASTRVLKSSTEHFRQLARLLPTPPPLQATPPPPRGRSPQYIPAPAGPGTTEDPLLSTRGEGLDTNSDACVGPPASHVGTKPSNILLPDQAEGSTNTSSRSYPEAWPSPGPSSEASSFPIGPTNRRPRPKRQLPPLPDSPVFPSQLQQLK